MTTIKAEVVLSSRNAADPDPNRRLTTVLCRYPRFIHAEVMTHRLFSRNAASSRAIPVSKMIASIRADPAVPLFWGKNQKGMQAGEEIDAPILWPHPLDPNGEHPVFSKTEIPREAGWLWAMEQALTAAKLFDTAGYHKQIVNRLLEPFMHITVLISATEWQNFFNLRIHPDAEPHIRLLAERIKEAIDTSPVEMLQPGDWHLPFTDVTDGNGHRVQTTGELLHQMKRLSTACCASTSYKTVDGFDMTMDTANRIYDGLTSNGHWSPTEHVARAGEWEEAHQGPYGEWRTGRWLNSPQLGNFVGFTQHRHRP